MRQPAAATSLDAPSRAPSELALERANERDYRVAWVSQMVFFVGFYALIVPMPRQLASLGFPDWQVGLILGATAAASLLLRPISGPLTDALGAKRLMLFGALSLCVGAFGVLFTASAGVLFLLRMLQSAGYVAFTTSGNALVSKLSSPQTRATRVAYFGMAANFAMALVPGAVDLLLPVIGLLNAFVISGLFSGAAGLGSRAIRTPQPPVREFNTRNLGSWKFPRVLWLSMACAALLGAGFGAYFQFFSLLAERRNITPAGALFASYGIAIILTRLIMGGRLERIGFRRIMVASVLIMATGLGLAALSEHVAPMMLAAMFIAVGGGLFHPTLIAHHVLLLPAQSGRAVSCFYFGFDLGIGVGAWVLGAVLDAGGFAPMYFVAAAVTLLSIGLIPRLEAQRRAAGLVAPK